MNKRRIKKKKDYFDSKIVVEDDDAIVTLKEHSQKDTIRVIEVSGVAADYLDMSLFNEYTNLEEIIIHFIDGIKHIDLTTLSEHHHLKIIKITKTTLESIILPNVKDTRIERIILSNNHLRWLDLEPLSKRTHSLIRTHISFLNNVGMVYVDITPFLEMETPPNIEIDYNILYVYYSDNDLHKKAVALLGPIHERIVRIPEKPSNEVLLYMVKTGYYNEARVAADILLHRRSIEIVPEIVKAVFDNSRFDIPMMPEPVERSAWKGVIDIFTPDEMRIVESMLENKETIEALYKLAFDIIVQNDRTVREDHLIAHRWRVFKRMSRFLLSSDVGRIFIAEEMDCDDYYSRVTSFLVSLYHDDKDDLFQKLKNIVFPKEEDEFINKLRTEFVDSKFPEDTKLYRRICEKAKEKDSS